MARGFGVAASGLRWQLPTDSSSISAEGFEATWAVGGLALGQSLLSKQDPGPPDAADILGTNELGHGAYPLAGMVFPHDARSPGQSMAATIRLVDPVDVYVRVERAIKYGFLFIGFTFLAYLMFDVIAGASVAAAEYLLTGVGLVLFFVLLLAFAEAIGFPIAYALASSAIIGLLTAYSAAVLRSWTRARAIAGMLTGLFALLYVLLSLEAFSLLIGSVLLFVALAGVMYATRHVDWSSTGGDSAGGVEGEAQA